MAARTIATFPAFAVAPATPTAPAALTGFRALGRGCAARGGEQFSLGGRRVFGQLRLAWFAGFALFLRFALLAGLARFSRFPRFAGFLGLAALLAAVFTAFLAFRALSPISALGTRRARRAFVAPGFAVGARLRCTLVAAFRPFAALAARIAALAAA
ncbi:MAG TPA: hypothetical protein PK958_16540, partial [Rhodocyclaceae bacterium]|nr:hypothetical protein [Rhodocyclaceae bacterium]